MNRRVEDAVEAGRDAMRRHAWEEARDVLAAADARGELDAESLRLLGKAREWCSDLKGCLDAFERSYAAFVAAGDNRGAANVALMLRHECANGLGDFAAARGWVQRAERLLDGVPECAEFGFLWRAQGRRAFIDDKPEEGRRLLEKAVELGVRLGDANLVAMSLAWLGVSLAIIGEADEACRYLDEACASAAGGELGPWATGIVYCNTIDAYRNLGEFAMAGEWTETAGRWCRRESIAGFPGICRVHQAEFLRLRGAWMDAEREARRAGAELLPTLPAFAGQASAEVGEIRLRMGDLEAAEAAFKTAHELGGESQPGAAMLLVAQGRPEAALRSLETALQQPGSSVLDQLRLLATLVEVACDIGDLERAERGAVQAESLVANQHAVGLQVLALQARGHVQLARDNADAHITLRQVQRLWQEINAPYEAALVRLRLARALLKTGDEAGARREGEAALAAFERLGAPLDVERARQQLADHAATHGGAHSAIARTTLFFSDIVGSTQLVEAIGDEAWADLVTWHDTALRECFTHYGGEEVDHAGDGFFVVFPDPSAALECACSIQRNLAEHRRVHGFAPRVRMGVHAATVTRSGRRYRGRGVHEASRIASLAGPDQILASQDTVPGAFATSDANAAPLKGLKSPLRLVTVDWRRPG